MISPRGKMGYDSYKEIKYGMFHDMLPYISEESLVNYTKLFRKYCYEHHKVKHYSLLEYLLERENIYKIDFELEKEFGDMVDLFLFRYKAVFTTENLHMYMPDSAREKVINNLMEI